MEPHRESFLVRSYEVDAQERLTVPALCGYLQEAARLHAAALGASSRELAARGLAWVLHRLRIQILGDPRLDDALEVVTWPSLFDRVVASREFAVRDAEGGAVAAATSRWVVVDLGARRVLRLPEFIRGLPADARPALDIAPDGIPTTGGVQAERRFEVRRSDIDATGHVNHLHAIGWILETVPGALAESHRPVELDVAFRQECVYGDVAVARASCPAEAAPDGVGLAHVLQHQDGRELVRATTLWRRHGSFARPHEPTSE